MNMTKNSFTEGFEHQSAWARLLSALEEKLNDIGHTLKPYGETAQNSLCKVFQSLPHEVQHSLKSTQGAVQNYYHALAGTSTQELFDDLSHLKVTPATVTLVLTTLSTVLFTLKLLSPAQKAKSTHQPKKKKQSRSQKANKQIQAILDHVEETYVPQIDEYLENFLSYSKDDQQYKYKYFEEMLLVELMKLDDVNVAGNDILRANRKKVIRFIQDHQKRLDTVKSSLA